MGSLNQNWSLLPKLPTENSFCRGPISVPQIYVIPQLYFVIIFILFRSHNRKFIWWFHLISFRYDNLILNSKYNKILLLCSSKFYSLKLSYILVLLTEWCGKFYYLNILNENLLDYRVHNTLPEVENIYFRSWYSHILWTKVAI